MRCEKKFEQYWNCSTYSTYSITAKRLPTVGVVYCRVLRTVHVTHITQREQNCIYIETITEYRGQTSLLFIPFIDKESKFVKIRDRMMLIPDTTT